MAPPSLFVVVLFVSKKMKMIWWPLDLKSMVYIRCTRHPFI
jgi:hypothetical protein